MAHEQICIPPGGARVVWAPADKAARLVETGRAEYVRRAPAADPAAAPQSRVPRKARR